MNSSDNGFLSKAYDKLTTYYTPKKVIDYIEDQKMKAIIGNPPFKTE